ncbi:MAG: BamA/TamA family outer membrane protein, partial [Planctomycetota bacterium]
LGAVGYASVNLDFFGLGADPGEDRSTDLNFEGAFIIQEIKFQLGKSNWILGADYNFARIDTTLDLGFPILPPFRTADQSSGLGVLASYDTRDNHFTPTNGTDALLGFRYYAEALGSDNDYYTGRAQYRTWLPIGDKVVLGLRGDAAGASDETPLYNLPFIQLRGVPAFRYVDQYAFTLEVEPRIQITDRWGVVVFGGVGRTAGTLSDLSESDTVYSVGAGFRYFLARKYGIHAGVDVAYSDDDFAFYITVGSAWLR